MDIYIVLPIIIFVLGWIRIYFAIPISIVLLIFLFRGIEKDDNSVLIDKTNYMFWIYILLFCALWVYFSGIGGLAYQNTDFWARNLIYHELCENEWPVKYINVYGYDTAYLSYYFAWWLPVAYVSKIFKLSNSMADILLLGWSVIGIFLVIYNLCQKLKKRTFIIPLIFIFFSGLDAIGTYIELNMFIPNSTHIEYWAQFFQYSSNTTQLFWVFNQSIPVWLIMSRILTSNKKRHKIAMFSLIFAYSPWAMIGAFPLIIYEIFVNRKDYKDYLSIENICIPIIMLIIYGLFYKSGSATSDSYIGSVFRYNSEVGEKRVLMNYILFVLLEVGIYFIIIEKYAKKLEYYGMVWLELHIIPLIYITGRIFVMRSSIPLLFLLVYYILYSLINMIKEKRFIKAALLTVILLIGSITPLAEIKRSAENTVLSSDVICEPYTLKSNKTEKNTEILKNQFLSEYNENNLYYKILSR